MTTQTTTTNANRKPLTLKEVGRILNVPRDTVRGWVGAGKVPAFKYPKTKCWRVWSDDLDRFRNPNHDRMTPAAIRDALERHGI